MPSEMDTKQDRKRNPDGTFAPSEKKMESVELSGGIEEKEVYEESLDRPGLTEDEGAGQLEELLREAEGIEPEDIETLPPEERQELKDRAEESGELEDAARFLEEQLKAAEAGEGEEGEDAPTGEAVPFDHISEELGVSPDDVTVKAKVDGEEMEVSLREAVNGYQRQKDYTRKTSELAEQREQVTADAERLAKQSEALAIGLQQAGVSPEQLQGLEAIWQEANARVTQARQAQINEAAAEGREKLRESFGWKDDADWGIARSQLRSYLTSEYGYDSETLGSVYDHRLLELAEKARRYDQEGTGRKPSPTLRPGQGNRNPARLSNPERQVREARERLARTGSVDDAATAIEGILGDDI